MKNSATTNEIIVQLDNILKKAVSSEDLESLIAKSSIDDKTNNDKQSPNDNVTTIDEIFGETDVATSDSSNLKSDLIIDSPLQSLIEFIQGDMVVKSKNLYALKKLLNEEGAKLKLKSSTGQFLFSNNSDFNNDKPCLDLPIHFCK